MSNVKNIADAQRARLEERIERMRQNVLSLPPAEKLRLAADLLDAGQKEMAIGVAIGALTELQK
jgi:hypothetical protein